MKTNKTEKYILAVLLVLAVIFPFISGTYLLSVGISIMIMMVLGQSWNLMSGFAGQFSFGHAAFFGLGAYTSSMLFMDFGITPWVGLFAGMCVAAAMGVIIGFLSFRYKLRGDFFALVTLAFAEILKVLFNNSLPLHGAAGILIPYRDAPEEFLFENDRGFYFIILIMVIASTLVLGFIRKRKFGICLVAIKENQEAAASLGVPVLKYKLIAMAISSAIAAMAGTFYAQYYGFIDPSVVFVATISVEAIVPCIIGGVGTLLGPLLGALIIVPLQEISNNVFSGINGVNMVIYGAMIILFIIFCPDGIVGSIMKKVER